MAAPQAATPAARLETPPVTALGTASGPIRAAICVLPFSNLGDDVEQRVFSDGISEDIITELSRWRRLLEVRSRSASFKNRDSNVDTTRVARELNVRFVVEGSVRRRGDRIRITVQLIDAASGHQVWGDNFDRGQSEIFAVQHEVVQKIVSTLVGRVQATNADRARRKHPASLEAYECVLKGNALPWDDPTGAAEATRLFEKAIEIDPDYGMAYALLAQYRASTTGSFRPEIQRPSSMRPTIWRGAPSSSTMARAPAIRYWRRSACGATASSSLFSTCGVPSSSTRTTNGAWRTWRWCSATRVKRGGADLVVRAKQIDPYFDPPWYWRDAGCLCMFLHRYREALAMFEHIPLRSYRDAAYMAGCHARLGESERARALVTECLDKRPDFSIRHMMTKEPFKQVSDAEHLEQSLRLVDLPE